MTTRRTCPAGHGADTLGGADMSGRTWGGHFGGGGHGRPDMGGTLLGGRTCPAGHGAELFWGPPAGPPAKGDETPKAVP